MTGRRIPPAAASVIVERHHKAAWSTVIEVVQRDSPACSEAHNRVHPRTLSFVCAPSVPRESGLSHGGLAGTCTRAPDARAYSRTPRIQNSRQTNQGRSPPNLILAGPKPDWSAAQAAPFVRFNWLIVGAWRLIGRPTFTHQPPSPFPPRSFPSSLTEGTVARRVRSGDVWLLAVLDSAVMGSGVRQAPVIRPPSPPVEYGASGALRCTQNQRER